MLEAQAETTVRMPARAWRSMPIAAPGPFGMSIGTVMGSTRRGPRSRRVSHASSSVQTPPMPVDQSTASRSGADLGRTGIRPGLAARDERELARRVESLHLVAFQHVGRAVTFAVAAKVTGSCELGHPVVLEGASARLAGEQGLPAVTSGAADGRGRTDARDHDLLGHSRTLQWR